MPVGDAQAIQAYAGMNAAQLQSIAESRGRVDNDNSNEVVKQVIQKLVQAKEAEKKSEKKGAEQAQNRAQSNRADALLKDAAGGAFGEVGKQAAKLFADAPQKGQVSAQTREQFAEITQKTPQAGFAAASQFQKVNNAAVADPAMLVLVETAPQGGQAFDAIAKEVIDVASAFKDSELGPSAQKKMFKTAVKDSGAGQTAKSFARGKLPKLMNGSAQEAAANAFVRDPGKFKDVMRGLEKLTDPKLLSPKLNAADMKSNFSALSKAALGSSKLSVTLEAQEKFLASNKFHTMSAQARGQALHVCGRAPDQAQQVLKTMGNIRQERLPKFMQKIAAEGLTPEGIAKAESACKRPTIPLPPITAAGEGEAESDKGDIAFQAKLMQAANMVDRKNADYKKQLDSATCLKDVQSAEGPFSLAAMIGSAKTPEALAQATGCSLKRAQMVFKAHDNCEKKKAALKLTQLKTTKQRMLRGKPTAPLSHLKDKRTLTAGVPAKTTITLTAEQQSASSIEFRKLVGSKTAPPVGAETAASATASPVSSGPPSSAPSSSTPVDARNTQTIRPTAKSMKVGGGLAGWGANARAVGMDAEVERKKLAQLKQQKSAAFKADLTQVAKGPRIGRASDFVPLAAIVEAKTPWVQLSAAVKAAMRNLQLTANILESWFDGTKRAYSSLQAKPFEALTEIQQKSALLLGLEPANWNALAGLLAQNLKAQTPLRNAVTKHDVHNVAGKARA